jgi:hypothetical protein
VAVSTREEAFRETWAAAAAASASDAAASTAMPAPSVVGGSAGAFALSDGKADYGAHLEPSLIEAVRSLEEMPQLSLTSPTSFGEYCLHETNHELIVALAASASAITAEIKDHVEWELTAVVKPCVAFFFLKLCRELAHAGPFGSRYYTLASSE